jgi:hypothetical protein
MDVFREGALEKVMNVILIKTIGLVKKTKKYNVLGLFLNVCFRNYKSIV